MMPWVAFATIALVWGSTFAAIAVAVQGFTPMGLVGVRFTLAGLLALGLGRVRGEAALDREDWPTLILTGLLMILGGYTFMFWAELRISSGLAAVFVATLPITLVLGGRERLSGAAWAGLALGLVGVACVAGLRSGGTFSLGGILAILASNVLWAAGTLLGKARYRSPSSFTRTGWQMLAGGLPALLITVPTGSMTHGPLSPSVLVATAYLTMVGSLVAFSAYLYLIEVWPPSRVSTYTYLNALIAVVLGALWLNETFTAPMALGCLLILAGVALVEYAPRKAALSAGEA